MINIHLYPSLFLNESRILREAGSLSLSRLGLFDRIDLIGLGQKGVAPVEEVQDGIRIVRIGQCGGVGFLGNLARTAFGAVQYIISTATKSCPTLTVTVSQRCHLESC